MADVGSGTGGASVGASNGGLNDLQLAQLRKGLDGTIGAGTSETGDWGYCSLSASGSSLVKTGAGQLGAVICGTATGNITIYDGISSAGAVILATSALVVGRTLFNIAFRTGLFVVLSGAGVATVTYR